LKLSWRGFQPIRMSYSTWLIALNKFEPKLVFCSVFFYLELHKSVQVSKQQIQQRIVKFALITLKNHVRDHPFKTSANFPDFWLLREDPPLPLAVFYYIQWQIWPLTKCQRLKMDGLLIHFLWKHPVNSSQNMKMV
jgi:hypothetical protein